MPIEHLEFDILALVDAGNKGPHRQLKYLSHLADTTPFGQVEIDLKALSKASKFVDYQG